MAQLVQPATSRVLDVHLADVGRKRERNRRRRLRTLCLWLGLPTAYLWYRIGSGRPFDVFALPNIDWTIATPIIFFVLLFGVVGATQLFAFRSPHQVFRPEQIDVKLGDVVGVDVVKDEVVRSLNLFLRHQTFADEMGGRARRGLLFEGAPGTGKTLMAKAMAAEAGVPFLFATATSFQSSFQGATQRKIRGFFRALRKTARREGGAIGFIDEFDAIGLSRGGVATSFSPLPSSAAGSIASHCGGLEGLPVVAGVSPSATASRATVQTPLVGSADVQMAINELLVQLQSFEEPSPREQLRTRVVELLNTFLPAHRRIRQKPPVVANILVVASTNRADALDPALMRPGRFDRRLSFDLPTKNGRRALIDYFLARKSHQPELDQDERRDALAAVTQGYSPAMIEGLLDEALISAVRYGRRGMAWSDVEGARLATSVGLGQPVEYTDHERALIATHEAGHATVAWLVAPQRRLEILTIVKRREALGLLAHGDREDVFTRSRSELVGMLQIAMGGQCAEELFFGDVSTGPAGDLHYATGVAAMMVGSAGMLDTLVSFSAIESGAFSDSNLVGRVLGDPHGMAAVEDLLQRQKVAVRALLEANMHLVAALRDALVERHELIGKEITDVLETARAAAARPSVVDLRDTSRLPLDG